MIGPVIMLIGLDLFIRAMRPSWLLVLDISGEGDRIFVVNGVAGRCFIHGTKNPIGLIFTFNSLM
jgi:hypothetical protein